MNLSQIETEPIFQQQLPHKSGIVAVGLLLLDSLGLDLLISAGSPIHTSNPPAVARTNVNAR